MDDTFDLAGVEGGCWLRPPQGNTSVSIAYCGAVAPEAMAGTHRVAERLPNVALLAIMSPDRLHADWTAAQRARAAAGTDGGKTRALVERLMAQMPAEASVTTVIDAHAGQRLQASEFSGVDRSRENSPADLTEAATSSRTCCSGPHKIEVGLRRQQRTILPAAGRMDARATSEIRIPLHFA